MPSNRCLCALVLGTLALAAAPLYAQTYPVRPVRIITPLRLTAEHLSRAWSQTVVVENRPGAVSYASGFVGSPAHLIAAALEIATGTQMLHVPYKETTQLLVALGNGEISWTLASPGTAGAAVQTGKARLLALAAPSRLLAYKGVPTVAEAGGPKAFEVSAWTGIIAPAHTPAAIIDRVNRDIARAVADPKIRERYAAFGYEQYVMSREEMAKLMAVETARYAPVIKRLNLSLD